MKSIFGSMSYPIWYLFYVALFGILTAGAIIPVYILLFFIAFNPETEKLWRWLTGIRPLRIRAEKERLIPLLKEVSSAYAKTDGESTYSRNVKLYIQESMTINAYAFGRETLVLTKGSIDLLSNEALKGLIAHEMAHFHHSDTGRALFAYVANLPLTILMKKLRQINDSLETGLIKFLFGFVFYLFVTIEFLGDIIMMGHNREQEYEADKRASRWGFGEELAGALIQIYQVSMEKPKSIGEMIKSTHPPITKRIERLETALY